MLFWAFFAYAQKPNHEITVIGSKGIKIYVDKTANSKVDLTSLVTTYAGIHKENLRIRLTSLLAPDVYDKSIRIYDNRNIEIINRKKCDYTKKSIDCGILNEHWTLTSTIRVEDMRANLLMILYDEYGMEISSSTIPLSGWILLVPQYKKTTVTGQSLMGPTQTTILEQYPPKRKKIPPQVTSSHVSQAIMMLFLSIENIFLE